MVHHPESVVVDGASTERHGLVAIVDLLLNTFVSDSFFFFLLFLKSIIISILITLKFGNLSVQYIKNILLLKPVKILGLSFTLLEAFIFLILCIIFNVILLFLTVFMVISLFSGNESLNKLAGKTILLVVLFFLLQSVLIVSIEVLETASMGIDAVLSHHLQEPVLLESEVDDDCRDRHHADEQVGNGPQDNDGVGYLCLVNAIFFEWSSTEQDSSVDTAKDEY